MGTWRWVGLVVIAAAVLAAYAWYELTPPPTIDRPLTVSDARRLLEAQQYAAALETAQQILQRRRDDPQVLMVAAEAATKLQRFDEALQYYGRIPDTAEQAAVARWAAGEIQFHLGHASAAVREIEKSIALDPDLYYARERIISLYNTLGRRRETLPHLMYMLQTDRLQVEYLLFIGNLAKETANFEELQRYLRAQPDDPLPHLGLGRLAMERGQHAQAREHLERVVADLPQLVEGHAQLGLLYLKAYPQRLADWQAHLPTTAQAHPDVWYVRGRWLTPTHPAAAARCFAEAIRLDPNHLPAHQSLAQVLHQLGENEVAKDAGQRARRLQELNIALEQIYKARTYPPLLQQAAELTLDLGRLWETRGWCAYAAMLDPSLSWPREVLGRAQALLPASGPLPHTLPSHYLVARGDWAQRLPLPDTSLWNELATKREGPTAQPSDAAGESPPRFSDVTDASGIHFQFDNNTANQIDGRRIFETTGGGVGVLDYDRDGRPDVFLVQAGAYPVLPESPNPPDQLYRHLPVDQPRWTAATEAARISEGMFGQGIAVADANNDGLDDVYVCNIGRNRLWLNCGDGTFLPADPLLPSEDVWTSSALMVDLDLDGNVEIYDANYVSGEDVFTRLCPVGNKARSCSPLVFQPTPDRLWTGDGGQYRRIDMPSMVGNGLGCVAFALQGGRVPSVFVSVDQQANLFGVVVQTADGWTLEDEAIVRGLAYDADGNAQACMGIATADVNDDGALDLYVTNFYLEYNTLYQQTSFGFEDVTAVSGTAAATKPMLGFGTQFIDVQLDGIADLVVLNGHVDDHTHMNVPEAMPPQLFLGRGGGRFDLVDGPQAGDFFASRRLGRALAKLDADGDGDEDLIAQDLENPVAIVENQTPANRIPMRIELVGVDCDRNAFTAIATLESGDYRQTQQLVAGGGYQAANERQLTFAVPRDAGPLTLTIHWPGGGSESYAALHSGRKYIAIQGQGVHAVGTLR